MKWLKLLCICSLILSACSDKKMPDDVLPIDKMKSVMWDMILAGEYVKYLKEKDTTGLFDSTRYYTETLELHKTTREKFYKSYDYYKKHPKLDQELLDSVNNYANRTRSDIYENLYGKKIYTKRDDSLMKRRYKKDSLLRKKPVKLIDP